MFLPCLLLLFLPLLCKLPDEDQYESRPRDCTPPPTFSTPDLIRLIEIHAGTSTLSCSLFNTRTLDQEYVALSYTWGDLYPARTKETGATWETWPSIICNNRSFNVSRNLYGFLYELRAKEVLRPSWADVISIDQDDLDERAVQVSFIGDIYAGAEVVYIWLGKEDENTADAATLMSSLCEAIESKDVNVAYAFEAHEPRVWEYLEYPNPTNGQWLSISHIFSRSWFTRGWVLQEICSASAVRVLCGKVDVPLPSLADTALFLHWSRRAVSPYWAQDRMSRDSGSNITLFAKMLAVGVRREYDVVDCQTYRRLAENRCRGLTIKQQLFKSLEELLLINRDFQFADGKDKTYAPLALQKAMSPTLPDLEWIIPDYSKALEQVYTEACHFVIRNASGLTLPESSQIGDMTCFVKGGRIPFLLRPGFEDRRYKMIGGSYVHGSMDG